MQSSLDALQSLAGGDRNANNPNGMVANSLRRQKMIEELRRNLELQAGQKPGGAYSTVYGTTPSDVTNLQEDAADSIGAG